jgi:outer membrane protein assembly factor BamB
VCRTFPGEHFPLEVAAADAAAGPVAPPFLIRRKTAPPCSAPDWDFAAPAALATTTDGRDILIAPQKQGLVWAVNPDNGQVLWKQDVAREIAGRPRRDTLRRRRG